MNTIGDFIVNRGTYDIFSIVVEYMYGDYIEFKKPIDEMRLLSEPFRYGIDRLLVIKIRDSVIHGVPVPRSIRALDIDVCVEIDDEWWEETINDDTINSIRYLRIVCPKVFSIPNFRKLKYVEWDVKCPISLLNLDFNLDKLSIRNYEINVHYDIPELMSPALRSIELLYYYDNTAFLPKIIYNGIEELEIKLLDINYETVDLSPFRRLRRLSVYSDDSTYGAEINNLILPISIVEFSFNCNANNNNLDSCISLRKLDICSNSKIDIPNIPNIEELHLRRSHVRIHKTTLKRLKKLKLTNNVVSYNHEILYTDGQYIELLEPIHYVKYCDNIEELIIEDDSFINNDIGEIDIGTKKKLKRMRVELLAEGVKIVGEFPSLESWN